MKKVGLSTCFLDNYGACLQAYALQTKIEEAGCSCEIINFREPWGYWKPTNRDFIIYNEFLIKTIGLIRKDWIEMYGSRGKFNKFRKKYLKFTKEYNTTQSLYDDTDLDFDIYVCGSDQIWNPMFYKKNNPVYFLDFAPKGKKRIAYAPSIGLSEMPAEYKKEFARLINNLDYISVREIEGKKIAEEFTDKEVKVVLDPTLLLSGEQWRKMAASVKIKKPYIFCYLFGDRQYIGEFVEYVKNKTGLEVVCIPYTKREQESCYIKVRDAGPCDFLGLIKNAELVITDSFHATAFSINFNVPFYTLLRNEDNEEINMNSRIFSILEQTGLTERLVKPSVKYPFNININVDFTKANSWLDKKRKEDFADLKKELE